jgi:hypothetical protein
MSHLHVVLGGLVGEGREKHCKGPEGGRTSAAAGPQQVTGESNSCWWLVTGKDTWCNHDNLTPTRWGTVDAVAPALTQGARTQLLQAV